MALEFGGLGAEAGDATPEAVVILAAQRRVGGLGGIGEAVGVGAQSGAHDSLGVEGPAAVELLAQRGGGGDEQVTELAQRGGAGPDGAVSGDAEPPDRLEVSGGVLGGWGRFAREHLAGGGLGGDVGCEVGDRVGLGAVLTWPWAAVDPVSDVGAAPAVGAANPTYNRRSAHI